MPKIEKIYLCKLKCILMHEHFRNHSLCDLVKILLFNNFILNQNAFVHLTLQKPVLAAIQNLNEKFQKCTPMISGLAITDNA